MQYVIKRPVQAVSGTLLLFMALPLGWWAAQASQQGAVDPVLFMGLHTLVELLAVVVAMLVFVIGCHAILAAREGAVVSLGIGFLGVGLLDLLHIMSDDGMLNAAAGTMPQPALFFWLAAVALLIHVVLPFEQPVNQTQKRLAVFLMVAVAGMLGCVGLLRPDQLPALFLADQGPTFRKVSIEG